MDKHKHIDDRIPFIRILDESHHDGDELWVLAGLTRLLNVIRVWVFEIETRVVEVSLDHAQINEISPYIEASAREAALMLHQSYAVLISKDLKHDLAFMEDQLFKFETKYITTNMCMVITEERVTFQPERYNFLKHSLHGVLHDLNQPISTLIALVTTNQGQDGLDKDEYLQDAKNLTEQVKAQLQRGFQLVKGSFAVEEISVDTMVHLSQDTFESLLKPENIQFFVHKHPGKGTVLYSQMWFQGLISNIVDNAKKSFWIKGERLGHGDFERSIHVDIDVGEKSSGRKVLILKITDSGIGFSREMLEKGFDVGVSEWDDKDVVGQGVGMAAHVEFIKKLGGEVILHNLNSNGETDGAELVIKLPLV